METCNETLVIKRKKVLNSNDQKQIEQITKNTANKIYGQEVEEKPTKQLLTLLTPSLHEQLIRHTVECKMNGEKENDSASKIIRRLLSDYLKDVQN